MNFEEMLAKLYPINSKDNKFKNFIQKNIKGDLLEEYIRELAIYMIAKSNISGVAVLDKLLYEEDIEYLNKEFEKQKLDIIKDDIYFEITEDIDELGYFFIKANNEVIGIVEEDIELLTYLEKFILY